MAKSRATASAVRNALAVAAFALPVSAIAQTQGWDITPSIATDLTWTDNVGLDPDATADEQTAIEVTPGISVRRQSQRLNADLDYRLQAQYFDDSDLDEVNHFLGANGTGTLVENALFVDFRANISQQIIDPADRISLSTVSGAQNRSEVGSYLLYPYWRGDLGTFAQGQVGYRAGLVEYDDPSLRDSDEGEFNATVTGNPTRTGLGWTVSYTDSTTEYDNGQDIDLARGTLTLTYPVSPKTRLIVVGGVDDNDIGFDTARDIDGSFWQVGVSGQAGRFTAYELRAGDHFYGESYYGLVSREGRLLNLELEYDEIVSTTGRDQLDYESLLNYLSQVTGLELSLVQDEVFVRKRLTGIATLALAKTTIDGRLYTETREYRSSTGADDDDGVFGAVVGVNWRATENTDVGLDLTWRQFDLRGSTNEPEDFQVRLSAKRRLGNDFNLNLRVWHNRRSATRAPDEYEENAVTLGISKSF